MRNSISLELHNPSTIKYVEDYADEHNLTYDKVIEEIIFKAMTAEPQVEVNIPYGIAVKDKMTGYEGVVTGYANYYMHSPNRYLVESIDSTGRPIEQWVDEERLDLIR